MTISRDELNGRLCYLATNENLHAIIHGLDIKREDSILSIAAAGDQAFSMLEIASKVIAIDMNPKQLLYVKKQMELIRDKDFLTFRHPAMLLQRDKELGFEISQLAPLNEPGIQQRKKYFTDKRLHKIREKLDSMILSDGSVLDTLDEHKINKLYLTNIIGYNNSDFTENHFLFACVNKLTIGGLAYISNGTEEPTLLKKMAELGLEKEQDRTAKARFFETYWKPDVYKRIK